MSVVLVDLLFFTGTRGGMESYVRELYVRMPQTTNTYIALASSELAAMDTSWFPGRVVDTGISARNRISWAWGELRSVPRWARVLSADLIHSPANIGPWFSRVPVVLTIQDLLPFRHPEFIAGRYAAILRLLLRMGARHAAMIITISETSKRDIEHYLRVKPTDIVITPLAGSAPRSSANKRPARPALLALGNRLPHKNFERLLEALALIPAVRRPSLVITGGSASDPLEAVVNQLGLRAHVQLLGWVTSEQLEELYQAATAVIVPTLFEGFGLPVLEAMSRGCPVLCSDLPVLREVAGASAVFFDPLDPRSMSDAIEATVMDEVSLDRLHDDGIERARLFSWEETARLTADAFRRVE